MKKTLCAEPTLGTEPRCTDSPCTPPAGEERVSAEAEPQAAPASTPKPRLSRGLSPQPLPSRSLQVEGAFLPLAAQGQGLGGRSAWVHAGLGTWCSSCGLGPTGSDTGRASGHPGHTAAPQHLRSPRPGQFFGFYTTVGPFLCILTTRTAKRISKDNTSEI